MPLYSVVARILPIYVYVFYTNTHHTWFKMSTCTYVHTLRNNHRTMKRFNEFLDFWKKSPEHFPMLCTTAVSLDSFSFSFLLPSAIPILILIVISFPKSFGNFWVVKYGLDMIFTTVQYHMGSFQCTKNILYKMLNDIFLKYQTCRSVTCSFFPTVYRWVLYTFCYIFNKKKKKIK